MYKYVNVVIELFEFLFGIGNFVFINKVKNFVFMSFRFLYFSVLNIFVLIKKKKKRGKEKKTKRGKNI